MDSREFFNCQADSWDAMRAVDPEMIDSFLDRIPIRTGDTVLDVGTGTGVLLPQLLERVGASGRVVAVDVAEEMIRKARAKISDSRVEFLRADVANLPLEDGSVQGAICFSCFPHFEDQDQALGELARVTAPSGMLLIAHGDSRQAVNARHAEIGGPVAEHMLPDAVALRALMRENSWQPVEIKEGSGRYIARARRME